MNTNELFIHCPTVLICVVVTDDQLRLSHPPRSTDVVVYMGITFFFFFFLGGGQK